MKTYDRIKKMRYIFLIFTFFIFLSSSYANRKGHDEGHTQGKGHENHKGNGYGHDKDKKDKPCRGRGRRGCGGGHGDPGANELPLWLMGSLSLALAYKLNKKKVTIN